MARLETDDEFVLFADSQTADGAAFPGGWRVVTGKTSQAATEAASASGRRSIADMMAMRRAVAGEALDVMFFPAVYSYFPVARPVPCVVAFHDVIAETLPRLIFETRRSRLFWNIKCRLAARRSARVITVSKASKEGLMRLYGFPTEKVCAISEAAAELFASQAGEPRIDQGVLRRYGVHDGKRYLLYVGGISPHKNLDSLISAFARVVREPGHSDVRLLLVGDDAGDAFRTCHEELSGQIERLSLGESVEFLGYVPDDDLVHLYGAAQAFVLPSFLEGFGLPVVEAMSCGAAVLASDRGSLPEVLDGAGHLFDPSDVESIADALRRVLSDDSYRGELRARSVRRAGAFSWERSARQLIDLFHEIGGSKFESSIQERQQ